MTNLIKKQAPTDVVAHEVTEHTVNTDARVYSRMGWLVVLFGVCGFLLWAALAPLDKGMPLSGTVAKETNRKTVQHQNGGTIADILVKDGDVVKAGQVLVRMNNVQVASQLEMSQTQYYTSRASEARLLAERDSAGAMAFPPTLKAAAKDPAALAAVELQKQLFSSRRSSLQNELAAVDENIAGLKIQIKGLQDSRESKKVQLDILQEQLGNMRELAKEGYVPRSRLLDLERTYAQVNGAISEDIGNVGRAQRQVMELTLRRVQRTQDYQKEVRTQLADVQREASSLMARLSSQELDMANADVKAPVDGIVVGTSVFTKGGVVGPGMKMMEVVPSDDALIVEGQLAVNLIDKVHPGLPVEMMFSAFNTNTTPHVPGVLTQVSADRAVDERSGMPYYKVRARVTPEGVKLIEKNKLNIQSGMPVDMFIKTGERTMMSYLLKPLLDRVKTSLTEE
ncbi:MAG: HlyD family type I secretion periplasmic adaptor subunit [Burkholderiaceae bacterium]|nr:HlyD family type I secretion periplasmic adaptor subunit [Burkholderiaceae bacterium]